MKDKIAIHFLRRYEIDNQKWDDCISKSIQGLIYARAFYLDHMAKQWDALVLGNYDAVLPLTWNQKWKIPYLYQPPFVQQLGIFSKNRLDPAEVELFILAMKKRFHFAEIFLNSSSPMPGATPQDNFILNLNRSYAVIQAGYKEDLIKNLKRVKKLKLVYSCSEDYSAAIQSFRHNYGSRFPQVTARDYQHFKNLCLQASENNMLLVREALSADQETLATALLLKDSGRLYNLMSTTSQKGRRQGANHFLFEELIREFAGKEIILDFEGSQIAGIAKFYQKFGAANEPYFFLRYNTLSKPLKWLKK